ncbi:MAG: glycosyltransferase family A protein [Elusimicrobiota bacterium]
MRFSAVITHYDCGRFLPDALRSVLAQEPAPLEVLVVDDGSTDDTRERVRPFLDKIRFIERPHAGQAAALNAALPLCLGDWVVFLESDDVWSPGKLRILSRAAGQDPRLSAIQHSLLQTDERLRPLPTELPSASLRWTLEDFLADRTLLTGMSGLAVRREVLLGLLPLPEELLTCVDEYLQPRLLAVGPILHLPGSHALRRVHGANHYAGVREDLDRLRAYLRLRRSNARLREDFLKEKGLCASKARLFRESREESEFELFLARLEHRWSDALSCLRGLACRYRGGYAAFKILTLGLAVLSPGIYCAAHRFYEKMRLGRLRRTLLP